MLFIQSDQTTTNKCSTLVASHRPGDFWSRHIYQRPNALSDWLKARQHPNNIFHFNETQESNYCLTVGLFDSLKEAKTQSREHKDLLMISRPLSSA